MMNFRPAAMALLGLVAPLMGAQADAKDPASIDPLTADATALEAAVTLPEGLRLRPDQVLLDVVTTRGDVRLSERFRLRMRGGDERTTYLSLAPKDVARFHDWQRSALDLKLGGRTVGGMALSLGACTTGTGPTPDAVGSVGVRLHADAPMTVIIDRAPLIALLGPKNFAAVGPCP